MNCWFLIRNVALAAALAWMGPGALGATAETAESPTRGGIGKEIGFHYGSPLKLSCHASTILPMRVGPDETRAGVHRLEGLEFLVEGGVAGARAGIGWGSRGTPYLQGWSAGISLVRTWESVDDPLAYPANHSLWSLSSRVVTLGATIRGEILYDLDASADRWGVGWSVGLLIW